MNGETWVVIDAWNDDDERVVHIVPIYGQPHALDCNCWCQPECEEKSEGLVVIHEEDN